MSMALTGNNGDNETNIGSSKSLSYSLYDESNSEINVNNLVKPISLWISRDTSLVNSNESFKLVNALNATLLTNNNVSLVNKNEFQLINGFLVNGLILSGSNASIHILIKPVNKSLSYLTLLKFGDNPILNNNNKYFDQLNLHCPNDLIDNSFYLVFTNMTQVNRFKGYVGFSIIELNSNGLNCQNKSMNSVEKIIDVIQSKSQNNFSQNFWISIYSSGCYYMNSRTNEWSSDGVEIMSDSNLTHTHCITNHLTTFASGFIVLPNAIDFSHVWANASFLQNPVIYSTVIFLTSLYILLALWSRYMDSKDNQKMGFTLLDNNNLTGQNYLYEIIVFTGMRTNAGTNSNVSCIISSESTATDVIELKDRKRKLFQRGSIDSFVLSRNRPLKNVTAIKIWHDNSGKTSNEASWYLKHIIVHDLQTREKSYFICEKWLANDLDDFCIERILPISLDKEKTQFKYLLQKQTKNNLSDDHLWFSIFARPVQSNFSRLDRLTCCFVLLAMSMLMNIMYYGMSNSPSSDGLKIGPYFNLTLEQLSIGLITNLCIFPPSILLVQLFRRVKRKSSRVNKLKRLLEENDLINPVKNNEKSIIKKKKSFAEFKFPWWFKIIAYLISFVFAGVSIFFVIIKGIEFGDEKVTKWLTSLIVSFLSSILLTQPLQVCTFFRFKYINLFRSKFYIFKVAMVTFFLVSLFRSFDDKKELDNDDENQLNLNKWEGSNDDYLNEKSKYLAGSFETQNLDKEKLIEERLKQMKIKKCQKIIREIIFNFIFIWVLIVICYTNRNQNSFNYQNMIKNMFGGYKNVILFFL